MRVVGKIASWLIAVPLALVLLGLPAFVAIGATQQVTVQGFAFGPANLTVTVGDTVTWTNRDGAAHTATADVSGFNQMLSGNGGLGSVTFSAPGVFAYHCDFHTSMKGTITVVAAAPAATIAPTPAPTPAPTAASTPAATPTQARTTAPTLAPTAAPIAVPISAPTPSLTPSAPAPATSAAPRPSASPSPVAVVISATSAPSAAAARPTTAPTTSAPTAADGPNALIVGGTALILALGVSAVWRLRSR